MSAISKLKKALCKSKYCRCASILLHPNRYGDPTGEKTYYPELPRKSVREIQKDFISCIMKHNMVMKDEYYCMGIDRKGEKLSDYIFDTYDGHLGYTRSANSLPDQTIGHNYLCTANDKYVFALAAEAMGLPIPKTFGLYADGQIFLHDEKRYIPLSDIVNYDLDVMFKPATGVGGKGIVHIIVEDGKIREGSAMAPYKYLSASELQKMLDKNDGSRFYTGVHLIQNFAGNQHPDMKRLFPGSLNTLRVSVAKNPETGEYDVMGLMCLMGAGDMIVSNWHFGGVVVNVLPDGHLDRYGFSNAHKRVERHPDTGVVFSEIKIPFFEETIEMAKKATAMFYGHRTLGWDFAFTEDGPVIIETNNTWGVVAHQMVEGRGWAALDKKYFGDIEL